MKTKITQLQEENAKLEVDKAKFAAMAMAYQAEKAKGTPAHLIQPTPEATETALEAFLEKWAGIPIAKLGQAAIGTVVDVCGRHVVYHVGCGNHVIETLEAGRELPSLGGQIKPGLSR